MGQKCLIDDMSDQITDPRRLRLLEWLVAEKSGTQVPSTRSELAEEMGVDRKTLYRWGQEPEMVRRLRELLMDNAGPAERFAAVVDAMFEQALDHESSKQIGAAKWLSETFGLAAKAKEDVKPREQKQALMDLSVEDLDRLAAEVLAKEADK